MSISFWLTIILSIRWLAISFDAFYFTDFILSILYISFISSIFFHFAPDKIKKNRQNINSVNLHENLEYDESYILCLCAPIHIPTSVTLLTTMALMTCAWRVYSFKWQVDGDSPKLKYLTMVNSFMFWGCLHLAIEHAQVCLICAPIAFLVSLVCLSLLNALRIQCQMSLSRACITNSNNVTCTIAKVIFIKNLILIEVINKRLIKKISSKNSLIIKHKTFHCAIF